MHSNNSQNSGKGYLAYYSFIIAKGYKIEPTKGKDIRARSGRISNLTFPLASPSGVSLPYFPAQWCMTIFRILKKKTERHKYISRYNFQRYSCMLFMKWWRSNTIGNSHPTEENSPLEWKNLCTANADLRLTNIKRNPHSVWSNLVTNSIQKIYCQSQLKAAVLGRKNALITRCVKEKDFTLWNID